MRKTIAVLIVMFLMAFPLQVMAGEINANESRVLSAASGTFQYNGKTYKAKSGYLAQARSYMAADDIDLTSEQADRAISKMYASVEQGIRDGYLEEVGGASTGFEEKDDPDSTVEGEGDPQGEEPEEEEPIEPKPEVDPGEIIENPATGRLEAIDEDGDTIINIEKMVKNTGYDLTRVKIGAFGILGVFFFALLGAVGIKVKKVIQGERK